jgi:hypothetical protein
MNRNPLILTVLVLLLSFGHAHAQRRPIYEPPYELEKGFLIHFTSPLTLLAKGGVALEYKIGIQRSIMFGYNAYWGYFPGYQAYAVFRQYVNTRNPHESFFYVKSGIGHADYKPGAWLAGDQQVFVAPGDYFFAGGGVGRHRNFGHFYIEALLGLKYSFVPKPIANYNEQLFYVTGPGSFLDGGLNFGFQF